jgi:hypothetical protein
VSHERFLAVSLLIAIGRHRILHRPAPPWLRLQDPLSLAPSGRSLTGIRPAPWGGSDPEPAGPVPGGNRLSTAIGPSLLPKWSYSVVEVTVTWAT